MASSSIGPNSATQVVLDPQGQDGSTTEGDEGVWLERKATAIQAYFEWMPIRVVGRGRVKPMSSTVVRRCHPSVPLT